MTKLTGREKACVNLIAGLLMAALPIIFRHASQRIVIICALLGTLLILSAAFFYSSTVIREIEQK